MADWKLPTCDDVGGTVIGGYFDVGRLYYEGRPQGPQLAGESPDNLQAVAMAELDRIRLECGPVFRDIYPHDAWDLRCPG